MVVDFPGTVRTEEPGDNSGLHHEIQAVHRDLIAVTLAEILYFNHVFASQAMVG
jgi:hypothetical protein